MTCSKKPASHLRAESNSVTKSQATSTGVRSLEANNLSSEAEAIRKTIRTIADRSSHPRSDSINSMDVPQPVRFSVPDLNKSLPSPPHESSPLEEQKQPHISRLMKGIHRKKSTIAEGRSSLTNSTAPIPSSVEVQRTSAPRHTSTVPASRSAGQEPPKKKFRIPLFHRRQRPADVLVT